MWCSPLKLDTPAKQLNIMLDTAVCPDVRVYQPMKLLTTRQAAKVAGISLVTLQRWIRSGKVKAPKLRLIGGGTFRLWSKADVERIWKAKQKR